MADTYSRLVEAGAPEIREPYFYRVKEDPESAPDLLVELRIRNQRFGSTLVGSRTVSSADREPVLVLVVEALQSLVGDTPTAAA